MAEDPEALVGELLAYAWSQAVSLVVVGADNPEQVRLLAAAAQNFVPMTPGGTARPGRGRGPLCPGADVL